MRRVVSISRNGLNTKLFVVRGRPRVMHRREKTPTKIQSLQKIISIFRSMPINRCQNRETGIFRLARFHGHIPI